MSEDYIELSELEHRIKPKVVTRKVDFVLILQRVFKAIGITFRALWFGLTMVGTGLWKMFLALQKGLDKAQKSKMGQNMMKDYEKKNTGFSFQMQPQGKRNNKKAENNPFSFN